MPFPAPPFVLLEGAAHSPQLETPDAWWAAVTGFLDPLADSISPTKAQKEPADDDDHRTEGRRAGPVPGLTDLTLDEQAALTAGADMWHTAGRRTARRAGFGVTDGPSGARGTAVHGLDLDVAAVRHRAGVDVEPRADRTRRPSAR